MPVAILLLFLTYTLYDFYNASSLFKEPAPPPVDCILLSAMQPDVQHGLKISGLVCAAVAEVLVLAATWRATYRARRASDSSSTKTSVSAMLLRDGTVYFGVILLLLIANAVLELVATDVSITSLTYVLQTVCITHLYINLRHAASSNTLPGEDSQIHVSFSRVLGTLDGSLVFGSDGYASDGAVIDNALALYVTSMGGKTEGIAMLNMASSERSSDLDASLALKQGSLDMCARAV
ncbi:uncharacterized protein C8Q71DRAFT_735415 [Rhodofomes roseus]|nr:uncharacterized protein C8Q71DRAFT_735415 [Rhodofomes roseus]KAH9842978.1 hypothetical protein C8Q71DRAFT_735415 [Rhodofomes roseus]